MIGMKFNLSIESIENLYRVFDILMKDKTILTTVLKGGEVILQLNIGDYHTIKCGDITYNVDASKFNFLVLSGTLKGKDKEFKLKRVGKITFNNAYFYYMKDIIGCCTGVKCIVNQMGYFYIMPPNGGKHEFIDICSVRDKYSKIIKNGLVYHDLLPDLVKLKNKVDWFGYLFKVNLLDKSYIGMLYEEGGRVYYGAKELGFRPIEDVLYEEEEFFPVLLDIVQYIDKPVHCVYFYNNMKWTEMFLRPSKDVEGEYDLIIK